MDIFFVTESWLFKNIFKIEVGGWFCYSVTLWIVFMGFWHIAISLRFLSASNIYTTAICSSERRKEERRRSYLFPLISLGLIPWCAISVNWSGILTYNRTTWTSLSSSGGDYGVMKRQFASALCIMNVTLQNTYWYYTITIPHKTGFLSRNSCLLKCFRKLISFEKLMLM